MIIVDCEQGTQEWFKARLGIPTASRFKDILTQPRSKKDKDAGVMGDTAETYMCELLAERMLDESRVITAKALEWGNTEEPKALAEYSFNTDADVQQIGFITRDDGLVGCSPDFLVGEDGGGEIKSPENPSVHIKTILRGEIHKDHIPQVQGGLWLCERAWWDFVSFRNDMPPSSAMFVTRVYRDEEYIRDLSMKVNRFIEILQEKHNQLMGL